MQIFKKNVISFSCALTIILFLSFFTPPFTSADEAAGPGVTVLIYHRFDESRYPTTNVSAERFREQLAYLMMNHYQVISLADLVSAIEHKTPLPDKAVVITIDDGYRSVYDVAWPILQSFGYPFTVFLYVKGVDSGSKAYMTWDQVREVQKQGGDFQDHSYSHYRLIERPKGLDDAGYRAWIRDDLQKGAQILEKNLGHKAQFLAIPYGEYNTIVQQEAKKLGYEAIMSQDPGSISLETDLNSIPREPILGNEWSTMKHFEEVLNRIDMPVTVMEPSPAPLKSALMKKFGATLLYPDRYETTSFGIYVSELGWHRASVDKGFVYIDNNRPLQRHVNRVTVSGKDKKTGRLALRTWMIVRPD
ncbi:MAG: polysaccharide deacetylase family protein [Proteobacteria bacterium]|nr:polysaccharide deacetylase family protein [Pseudomonadota bacterium]MBU4295609.1 polysaccharide deacetylase family protein [Pseudomonadota bacterium]MCG2746800.1 polysaccharide deacetylase family protein [Desulfobulbaceae bacterium]